MSTWISKATSLLAAMTLLAGCLEDGGFALGSAPQTRMAVAGGTVTVAGPDGYCVDRGASRDAGGSSFVLLASCPAVTGRDDLPAPPFPALLTATVAAPEVGAGPVSDQSAALRRYFGSSTGRSALARDGDPGNVDVIRTLSRDGLFVIQARDSSPDETGALGQAHWRAIFDAGGHVVSASVVALSERPLSDDAGLALVTEFAERIRRATLAVSDTDALE